MTDDQKATWDRFNDTVNMTARELERWLGTEESKSVGQKRELAKPPATPVAVASSRYSRPNVPTSRMPIMCTCERLSATPSATWRNAPAAT